MRGDNLPKPYFETKLKVRWDDERLFIGAYMQETDFWGTLTEDESKSKYLPYSFYLPQGALRFIIAPL